MLKFSKIKYHLWITILRVYNREVVMCAIILIFILHSEKE